VLLRSQRNHNQLNPGFPIAELDQFRVGTRGPEYANNPEKRRQFFERVAENLRALPGVREVGVASFIFTQPPIGYGGFVQEGDGLQLGESPKRALQCSVLPTYFSAMELRLIEGRLLTDNDVTGRPYVAVINQSLAAKYWPGQSPLGKRVRLEGPRSAEWVEIVGVVSDILGTGNQPRVIDVFHLTIAQWQPIGLGMSFIVRHRGVVPDERSLQQAMAKADPAMQFFGHISPAQLYYRGAWQTRLVTQLVVGFALLAVVLALAGIYAVNSFFVACRINEFGVRAALGATHGNLLRLVLGDSLRLATIGLAVGVVLAVVASRGLSTLLYNVAAVDALVYLAAALVMTVACALASLIPARRAAKVDPIIALRAE
jgi:predicted permease